MVTLFLESNSYHNTKLNFDKNQQIKLDQFFNSFSSLASILFLNFISKTKF